MKNKGIIINGEWLGERVVTDGLFHAVCNISPIIMQEFIKVINKIDATDNAVRISKFEFPDRNSIDIEFTGEDLSGLASLYFKLNEGSPELINRRVVIYNLDGEAQEVLKDDLAKSKSEELIPMSEELIREKISSKSQSVSGSAVNNTAAGGNISAPGTVSQGVAMPGQTVPGTGNMPPSNMPYNTVQQMSQPVNQVNNAGFAGQQNQPMAFGGYSSDQPDFVQGQMGEDAYNGGTNFPNMSPDEMNQFGNGMGDAFGFYDENQNPSQAGMPGMNPAEQGAMNMPSAAQNGMAADFNNTRPNGGGGEGNLASQIADELCKKIPSLSIPPIQVNLQTPNGTTPMPAQQGGMPPQQRQGGFGGNPPPNRGGQQRPTINDFSAQPNREGFNGQRGGGFGRNNSGADFSRRERPQITPKPITPSDDSKEKTETKPEEIKKEDAAVENAENSVEKTPDVTPNETDKQDVPQNDTSKTDDALMEMHDELKLLREELLELRSMKDPKLMTIEEFLESQKETKPETFGTKFKIMGSKGSSVNANLLDDGFFVAGDKIYRWGDTLHLDK